MAGHGPTRPPRRAAIRALFANRPLRRTSMLALIAVASLIAAATAISYQRSAAHDLAAANVSQVALTARLSTVKAQTQAATSSAKASRQLIATDVKDARIYRRETQAENVAWNALWNQFCSQYHSLYYDPKHPEC